MAHRLRLTVQYEEGQDGWIIARVRELPAAMSQGRNRQEARENVLDALQELALSFLGGEPTPHERDDGETAPHERDDTEPLEVTIR
jgi:predicted RNase H-like HicB family nuclease